MIKCPNPDCGYENVDGTQYCEGCSEALTPNAAPASPSASASAPAGAVASNMIKCPACDNLNPAENVVCEVCGSELRPGTTGTTAPPTAPLDTTMSSGTDAVTQAVGSAAPMGAANAPATNTGDAGMGAAFPSTAPMSGITGGTVTPTPATSSLAPDGGAASPPASLTVFDTATTMGAPSSSPDLAMPGLSDASSADAMTPVVAGGDITSPVSMPSAPATPAPSMDALAPDTIAPDTTPSVTATTSAAPSTDTAPGSLQPGHIKLVVEQGMSVGAQFVLGDAEMQVGREDEEESIYPDIDLSDQDAGYVHRRHATLKFDNGHLTVTHLGGTNKTRVNNQPLPDNTPQEVKLGDKIAFGKVVMRVLAA